MFFYTYILAGRRNGVLYTGSTDDLLKRVVEHREKLRGGFTARYGVSCLVWYELHGTRDEAFRRERQGMAARMEARPDRADEPRLG
ncbi:GIY-YIG nuclease family protein [Brevundimonas naejangsanensis]|uniref:GIY-YIG nuclease family protein n=1 Tax=Brevundimonas naejangsanensis TaxID=588932 RepID=UPI0026AE81CD